MDALLQSTAWLRAIKTFHQLSDRAISASGSALIAIHSIGSGGDVSTEPEVLFDRADTLQEMIDFLGEAGHAVN